MYTTFTGINPQGLISNSFVNDAGSRNCAVNGSITPVVFKLTPRPGECLIIRSLNIVGLSAGASVGNELFVDIAALTNGLTFQFGKGSELLALHDRNPANLSASLFPIKTNADLAALSGSSLVLDVNGTDAVRCSWDFAQAGIQLRVKGVKNGFPQEEGEYLQVTVRDNLSTLGGLFIMACGHQEVA